MSVPPASIVLFDGVCNVCNGAVNFILHRDRAGRFKFASLQSDVGQRLSAKYGLPSDVSTIVLIDGGTAFVESTAVLRILRYLDGVARLGVVFGILPRPVRDALYRFFAARRYGWFGKRESCRVPTPEIRERFLVEDTG